MSKKITICFIWLTLSFIAEAQTKNQFIPKGEISTGHKGKATVINDTLDTFKMEVNVCEYDYNIDKKLTKNIGCQPSTYTLMPNQLVDFDLSPISKDQNVIHYQKAFIKKIISDKAYSYFIKDFDDAHDYKKYTDTPHFGVSRYAFECSFFYETDVHIYSTKKGFICLIL